MVLFFGLLVYCGSYCCYCFTIGFRERWSISAVGSCLLFSLLSQYLVLAVCGSFLVDLGMYVIDSSLPILNCFFDGCLGNAGKLF